MVSDYLVVIIFEQIFQYTVMAYIPVNLNNNHYITLLRSYYANIN